MLDRSLAALALSCLALSTLACGAAVDAPPTPGGLPATVAGTPTGHGATAASPPAGNAPIEVADADLALLKKSRVAARLADGRVLAAGADEDAPGAAAAQIFDTKGQRWADVGPMKVARVHHAIVALADGKALVCGGEQPSSAPTPFAVAGKPVDGCELFDPATNKFTAAPSMHAARRRFTLTRLADGRVLAVGDPGSEVFDPKKNTWSQAIATSVPYLGHTATLLQDGRVFVVGVGGAPFKASAEIFDPQTEKWSVEPAPPQALMEHSATLLPDGAVLIAGGQVVLGGLPRPLAFAAVFEPKHERWNVTGQPHATHWRHGALLLPNGDVVVAGGGSKDAELYTHEVWKDVPAPLAERLGLPAKEPAAAH